MLVNVDKKVSNSIINANQATVMAAKTAVNVVKSTIAKDASYI